MSNNGPGMIDRRTLSSLFTIAVVAATIGIVYAARHTVIAIIFAIFLAYILEPIVGLMQKWLRTRNRAVAGTYLALLVGIGLVALTTGPRIVHEVQRLNAQLPDLLENVGNGRIAWSLGDEHAWSDATKARVQEMLADNRETILHLIDVVKSHSAVVIENLAWVLIIPVLSIFFLLGKASLSASLLQLINASHERRILRNVLSDLDVMLAQYIRAQVMLSLLAAAAYTVFLAIIRFPYAFAIGPIAGMLEFIPLVGPLLAGISILTIAFGTSFGHWISIVLFWLIWRGIQDYYAMPHLMRRGLGIASTAGSDQRGVLAEWRSCGCSGHVSFSTSTGCRRDSRDLEKLCRAGQAARSPGRTRNRHRRCSLKSIVP